MDNNEFQPNAPQQASTGAPQTSNPLHPTVNDTSPATNGSFESTNTSPIAPETSSASPDENQPQQPTQSFATNSSTPQSFNGQPSGGEPGYAQYHRPQPEYGQFAPTQQYGAGINAPQQNYAYSPNTQIPPQNNGTFAPAPSMPLPQGYPYPPAPMNQKWNAMSIVGFILAFLIPPAGLVVSIIALVQINTSGEKSKGLSIAGIIISAIATILSILAIVALISLVSYVAEHPEYFEDNYSSYRTCTEDGTCRYSFNDPDLDFELGDDVTYLMNNDDPSITNSALINTASTDDWNAAVASL
ncbi:MAG: DUF4190 domain-containing protein [Bifidobacterium tsurumiense]|uniref:DUF4190 domain-containing protein n=1 Tax=Bifidobacterium tsurumiense TaxID=356829 RepID=UPI002A80D74F|nr:DUF4190 domain-containing protein [Bifidobacterium tsurumiense]MDY4677973.1 DUF4190 domain-containing protein [Bifidobacterium tsurumiense]